MSAVPQTSQTVNSPAAHAAAASETRRQWHGRLASAATHAAQLRGHLAERERVLANTGGCQLVDCTWVQEDVTLDFVVYVATDDPSSIRAVELRQIGGAHPTPHQLCYWESAIESELLAGGDLCEQVVSVATDSLWPR